MYYSICAATMSYNHILGCKDCYHLLLLIICGSIFYLLEKFYDEYVPNNISLGSFKITVRNPISGEEDKYRTIMMSVIYFRQLNCYKETWGTYDLMAH